MGFSLASCLGLDLPLDFSALDQHLHRLLLFHRLKYNNRSKKTGKTNNKGKRGRKRGIKPREISYGCKISKYQSKSSQRNYSEYCDHDEK